MTNPEHQRLFITDVCDTLYASNTTTDFARFVAARRGERWRRVVLAALLTRGSPLHLLSAVAYLGAGLDLGRAIVLATLRGITREELARHARAFVEEVLPRRRIDATQRLLREATARGDEVVLASASVDVVIEAIARHLAPGARWVCSTLAVDARGRATGALSQDMTGEKARHLDALISHARHVTVVTDNFSDRALLERADRPIIALRRPGDRGRWGQIEAEFLDVS